MTRTAPQHRVAILIYNGLCTFEFGIATEIFALERPELGVTWYETRVCSTTDKYVHALGGVRVNTPYSLGTLDWADTIIVPGWSSLDAPVAPRITDALVKAHSRGARIASICSGAFLLAAAGLLNQGQATTHWRHTDRLSQAYPNINVLPDALYVQNDRVLTSAGSAAGLDLCLHIVQQDYGAAIANKVAQRLLLPAHRSGGQTQYIPTPLVEEHLSLSPVLDKLLGSLEQSHTCESIAALANCSTRTLHRKFKQSTGQAPLEWLTAARVRRARQLLEETNLDTARISAEAGFATPETLRHHFKRAVGVAPMQYRQAFRAGS